MALFRFGLIAAALWAAAAQGAAAQSSAPPKAAPGAFDFYVFTLSWSPGFCDTGGSAKAPDQCAIGANKGFVVHGLWPDNRYADDPADCGFADVPSGALQATVGTYPNPGLARYEYQKHGTCTGLDPAAYFSSVKYLRGEIVTPEALKAPKDALRMSPDDIERAFMAANVNLHADNIAVTCSHGELIDVRLCVAKSLKAYEVCPPKVLGHSCRSAQITIAPLR